MKWLQAMIRAPPAAAQVRAAVWGHLPMEEPVVDNEGRLRPGATPYAKQFEADLMLFADLTAAEEFFEAWVATGSSWRALFSDEGLQEMFIRNDFGVLRAAARQQEELLEKLIGGSKARLDTDAVEWTCRLRTAQGDECGRLFGCEAALCMHQVRAQDHGWRRPLHLGVVTNQCPACSSCFASTASAQQHVRFAWQRGYCMPGLADSLWPAVAVVSCLPHV